MSTGTEIELRPQAGLTAKISYAHELANSGLLPSQYRRQPANILWAIEYGDMLGLSTMAAITGVHVIEGKPSASAGLISALVRRAGHKLRVRGDSRSATCQIIRSDDPDYTFEVTWTLKRNADGNPNAEDAGLLGKDVWRKYAPSMLKARAITQCARDACEEALFGLHYTPEELGAEVDEEGNIVAGEVVRDEAPARSAAPVREAQVVTTDEEWFGTILAAAAEFADEEAGRALWRESAAKARAGECTTEDARRIQDLIKARLEDLREGDEAQAAQDPASAPDAVLDPEDPWAAKIEALDGEEDAAAALTEVTGLLGDGVIDADRADRLRDAILARFPQAAQEAMVAA